MSFAARVPVDDASAPSSGFGSIDGVPRREMDRGAFRPWMPFTRACALRHGLTDKDLVSGDYHQVFWGVYVDRRVPVTPLLRIRTALLLAPDEAAASHHTATRLLNGIAPESAKVHLTYAGTRRPQTAEISPHRVQEMPDVVLRRGIPVTTPERTFLDMAGYCDLVELVVLGDSLVRARVTTLARLVAAAEAWEGDHYRLARRAASLVRSGVRSPMETRLRLLIVLAGLPEPTIEYAVTDVDGVVVYRIDLSIPGVKLAFEFDGRHHVERRDQWAHDVLRREDLENDGWKFVVVIGPQLLGEPTRVLARVKDAMAARGIRVPRRIPREWSRVFSDARISA